MIQCTERTENPTTAQRCGSVPGFPKKAHPCIRKEAGATKEKKQPIDPPKRSVPEEVGNAVTHGVGALAGIAGLVLLLLRSDTQMKVLAAVIYGTCLILLFLMSCLYHSFRWGSRVKRLWRRFDYLSIYLLISGTFTPFWLVFRGGTSGIVCCAVFWAAAVFGITMVAVFGPGRMKPLHMTLYIVMGWSGLVFLPDMLRNNPGKLSSGCGTCPEKNREEDRYESE